GWKFVARINGDSAYCRRGVPIQERLLHALVPAVGSGGSRPAGWPAAVIGAVRDDPPAVVAAPPGDVDLVAPPRAVLRLPDLSSLRVNEEPDRVADAEGIDLGPVTRSANERVVARDRAVVVQTQNLSRVIRRIL